MANGSALEANVELSHLDADDGEHMRAHAQLAPDS